MRLYMAPMEGITGWGYRRIYEKYFGHIDKYFTPFLSPGQDRVFTHRELQEILPEHNEGMEVVPQLLANRSGDFIWAAGELKQMGYREVNFNLGCPSGTVVAKRKGSGMLADPEALDECLYQIFEALDMKISIKTRIGKTDPEEFYELLSIYNRYPLSELIIHPRVQKEFYKGLPHMDIFREAEKESRNPVCYNGNLFTAADFEQFHLEFPNQDRVMLGRGLISNPALAAQIQEAGPRKPADEEILKQFHDELLAYYMEIMPGERNVLFKMKELWTYLLASFEDGEKLGKKIKKAQHLAEYRAAAEALFAEKRIRTDTGFRG